MQKINPNIPLHIAAIHFKTGDVIENKTAYIVEGFLIVENDNEDINPTWYSLDTIEALQEVSIEAANTSHRSGSRTIRFF